MWGKGTPCALVVGMYTVAATVEKSMKNPYKTKMVLSYNQQFHHCVFI